MPKQAWTGYGRFCPLARGLDIIGERWTLVIVQELMKRSSRYGELSQRLAGIGTSVLADRLRKLEAAGVVERRLGSVGDGVVYALIERGSALDDALEALRRWGVAYLTDPAADGTGRRSFDLDDCEFGLVVDGNPTTLRFTGGCLEQTVGAPDRAELVVRTTTDFMDRWADGP